nr:SURF1 family protein [Achromobacter aloeverae]
MTCLALIGLLLFSLFCALGTWQVHRRAWKLDLIARVDERVHAAPTPAPGPVDWPHVTADHDEYRRVRLDGAWMEGKDTLVQAVTGLGSGYWVLTPLRLAHGGIVLVNRGYIPADQRQAPRAAPLAAPVIGLLRISEVGGGFLRKNDPAADRWFSRDVAAIAAARGLPADQVAPYFVDADVGREFGSTAGSTPGSATGPTSAPSSALGPITPVGGLTVIQFPNSHLVYAITWYGLALMVLVAAVYVIRDERRRGVSADTAGGLER